MTEEMMFSIFAYFDILFFQKLSSVYIPNLNEFLLR